MQSGIGLETHRRTGRGGGRLYPDRDPDRRHPDVGRGRRRCACSAPPGGQRCGRSSTGGRAAGPGRGRPSRRSPATTSWPDLRAAVLERSSAPRLQGVRKQLRGKALDLTEALVLTPERARPPRWSPARTISPSAPVAGRPSAPLPLRHLARRELPLLLCEGQQNTKRLIVAVTLVPLPGTARPRRCGSRPSWWTPTPRPRGSGAARWRPGGRRPGHGRLVLPLRHSLRAGRAATSDR